MIAQRRSFFSGRKQRVAATVAAVSIGAASWLLFSGDSKPSYGGRPSKSLDFRLPKDATPTQRDFFGASVAVQPLASGTQEVSTIGRSGHTFVDAIVGRNSSAAFRLLTNKDKTFFGSATQFGASIARGAPWNDAKTTVTGNAITAIVGRTPQLDDALGLVTATATVSLPMVFESGEWHIDWRNRSVVSNSTLSESAAGQDVTRWASARQRCKPDVRLEHVTGLVGVVGLASALCGAKGEITTGDIASLETLDDSGPFVDAFGPEVLRWGRVVSLRTPIDMRAVVAPVGERWIVIGLARPAASSDLASIESSATQQSATQPPATQQSATRQSATP